jgi:hypothetical protein
MANHLYFENKKIYLELATCNKKYNNIAIMSGGNGKMELSDIILNEFILDAVYEKFWKNIYYNDAYVYYKNAILFMKNTQNHKYHSFFSNIINKHLYTKEFPRDEINNTKDWINCCDEDEYDITALTQDLLNLSLLTIKIMDEIFDICPKIPNDIIVYRFETRPYDNIPNFEKNKLFNSLGYLSTTIMPYYMTSKYFFLNTKKIKKNTIRIEYIIHIPKNSRGYYINMPYGPYRDISQDLIIGSQEHEIFLPRNNIYIINDVKKEKDIIFVSMALYAEPKIIRKSGNYGDAIIEKNDLQIKKYNLMDEKKSIKIKKNRRYRIYSELSKLFKNDYEHTMLDEITQAKRITKYNISDIVQWKTTTKYDPIKYAISKENLWYELLNWWLSKQIISSKLSKIFISVDMIYRGQTRPTIHDNACYSIVINSIINKNDIIKLYYPILFNTKFDSTMYGQDILILKKKYESSNDDVRDNIYQIDDSYPRFIIIEINANDNIKWIQLPYEYGLAIDYNIRIEKINKINIYDKVYGYYIMANFIKK